MDSRAASTASRSPAASTSSLELKKPHWLYTPPVVRVAKAALAVFAALFAARALYLVCSGISVLTPAFAISTVIAAICCLALRYLFTPAKVASIASPSPSPAPLVTAEAAAANCAAQRQAEIDRIIRDPYHPGGILGHLRDSPNLSHDEVAKLLANHKARTLPFTQFYVIYVHEGIALITNENAQRRLFYSFLESLPELSIRPNYSQYEPVVSCFMKTLLGASLQAEFKEAWERKLSVLQTEARDRFLTALKDPIFYSDLLSAMENGFDPSERLGLTCEQVFTAIVDPAFVRYNLGEFTARYRLEAFEHLSVGKDVIIDKLKDFVDIERTRIPDIKAEHFDRYIGYLCGDDASFRVELEECVRTELSRSPMLSPTPVTAATAAASAASSSLSSAAAPASTGAGQ